MKVRHMTYARVAQGAAPGPAVMRPRDGLDDFLLDHFRAMHKLATDNHSPFATFSDPAAQALFEQLRAGSNDEFLKAAHELTVRLIVRMDGRMDPGLLLCMQVESGMQLWAAALKLEIVTPHSAILERLDSGDEVLAAVTDVVDAPGELQKGALVSDPRDGSDVVIGDKLAKDALYFPQAFGIRSEQRASDAAADLVAAVEQIDPKLGRRVAEVLPHVPPGDRETVLDALTEEITTFTSDVRQDVAAALQARPRPVVHVDTQTPLKREVTTAEGIKIVGPVSAMQAVTWAPRQDGGWRITIDVTQEPRSHVKR